MRGGILEVNPEGREWWQQDARLPIRVETFFEK